MIADALQSLDLQSVANAHLCASLLRIKAVAESPRLPDEVKNGVPKPEISEEERALLHNVTSGLYNQTKVRDVIDKAITDFCRTLQVPIPDKRGKVKKGDKKTDTDGRKNPEEQSADRTKGSRDNSDQKIKRRDIGDDATDPLELEQDEEEEWNGLSDPEEEDEEAEEKALARFDNRLGGLDSADSNDDDEYDTANEELDPMEITDESASDQSDVEVSAGDDASDEEGISEVDESEDSEGDEEDDDESDVSAVSPPPKMRKESKKSGTTKVTDTKFLPSLMGGYVSGSESEASDIDVAPTARKNRRGQRARQAIWEKKFKEQAKHLEKQNSGRDAGWDLKRGAVDGSSRTPWKQGIKTPFEKRSATNHEGEHHTPVESRPKPQKKTPKKDDEGPLHPSWEARKKAKEAQQTAAFQGKRVVFD